jgi:hypothetical protein
MLEIHSIALPLKEERKGMKPKHGPGGNSTRSTKPKCGAKTRAGGGHPCLRIAGHGTDHLGMGRCKYHGGATPTKHGLYSKIVKTKRRADYEAAQLALREGDPKDMLDHLALLDSVILPGALDRGEAAPTHEGQVDPLLVQMRAIDIRSKVTKRMHDMEQSQKISFTQSELKMFMLQVVTIVAEFVDAQTLRKIAARIGAGSLRAGTGGGVPASGAHGG